MLKICMLIHGENFKAWTQSDAFKEAHKNTGKSSTEDSPVVTSEIVKANVLSTLEQKKKQEGIGIAFINPYPASFLQ